jgi:hypothetical protein
MIKTHVRPQVIANSQLRVTQKHAFLCTKNNTPFIYHVSLSKFHMPKKDMGYAKKIHAKGHVDDC